MFILIELLIITVKGEWEILDQSFTGNSISQNNWKNSDSTSSGGSNSNSILSQQCSFIQQQIVLLNSQQSSIQKEFTVIPNELKISFDVYSKNDISILQSTIGNNVQITLSEGTRTLGTDICQNIHTFVISVTSYYKNPFIIQFQTTNTIYEFGLRNVFVYVNYCHPKCQKCQLDNTSFCTSCYNNGQPDLNGQCSYTETIYESYYFQKGIGPISQCPTNYYRLDSNKICYFNSKIQTYQTFFQDSFDISQLNQFSLNSSAIDYNPCSQKVVGKFLNQQLFQYQLSSNAISIVRIRFNVHMFGNVSEWKMLINNQNYGTKILFDSSIYKYLIYRPFNFTSNCNCQSTSDYICIGLEYILINAQKFNNNIIIQLFSNSTTGYWGLSQFIIDYGQCQPNCQSCFDQDSCAICEDDYFLIDGQCYQLESCPIYTSNCVDYKDEIQNSQYLIKDFFNLTMNYESITQFFDNYDQAQQYSQTGQFFQVFPDKIVLGGYKVWNNTYSIIKTYLNLSPHYAISVRFNITFIDNFQGTFIFSLNLIQSEIQIDSDSSTQTNIICQDQNEITQFFYSYYEDNSDQITLQFTCNSNNNFEGYCAISEYFVIIHQCTDGCYQCISLDKCICTQEYFKTVIDEKCVCMDGYYEEYKNLQCLPICGDNKIVEGEDCDDGNILPFDGCHQCKFSCQIQCHSCFHGQCLQCQEGYYLTYTFECIQENQYQVNVSQLKYQFTTNLIEQYSFQQSIDYCSDFCSFCLNGQCQQCKGNQNCLCQQGYYNNQGNCITICGDGFLTQNEECDDQNKIQFDGCFNCLLECKNCNICQVGICNQCINGYYFDSNKICQIIQCGDGYSVDMEECDDGNLISGDGCYECKCEIGWQSINNQCKPICGDQIVVLSEQCDDGNLIQYDGCYECQLDCDINCTLCDEGTCKICKNQYNLKNNQCLSTCGDSIITLEFEECDDGNTYARDGCFNCQIEKGYICLYNYDNMHFIQCQKCKEYYCDECQIIQQTQVCVSCQQGYFLDQNKKCQQCDISCLSCIQNQYQCVIANSIFQDQQQCQKQLGYYYDQQYQKCMNYCGDGIIVQEEECDDGNQNNFDGCNSNCKIEFGYILDLSINKTIQEPNLNIKLDTINTLNSTNKQNSYIIQTNTDYQIINCSLTQISVDSFTQVDYNYTLGQQNNNCQVILIFFKTIEVYNLIHFYLYYQITYKKRMLQDYSQELIIQPQRQVYSTPEQIQQGEYITQISSILTQSIYALGPLAILLGGFQFIWAMLDILSWINNFYFLNVNYPENVNQLFEQANWSTLIQLPSIQLFNNPNDDYYFEAPLKFNDKGIDPLFLNNIQNIIIFIFLLFITNIGCLCFQKLFKFTCNKLNTKQRVLGIFTLEQSYNFENNNCNVKNTFGQPQYSNSSFFYKFMFKIYMKCQKQNNNFYTNCLSTLQLSYLDLTLAIILQIDNQQTSNYLFIKLNIIIATISILILIILLYFSYTTSLKHNILLTNQQFQEKYECFYEEVSTDTPQQMLYSFINLIRKTTYIISIVIFYETPIIQTTCCFFSCLLNFGLVIYKYPFKTKEHFVINFIPDFGILIIVGMTIVFSFEDKFQNIGYQTVYFLGWIIVGSIYTALGIQIIYLLKELINDIVEKVKNCNDKQKKQN